VTTSLRRVLLPLFVTAMMVTVGLSIHPASAAADSAALLNPYESDLLSRTNGARAAAGQPALVAQPGLTDLARNWARTMGSSSVLGHNPDLGQNLTASGAAAWTAAAENVGVGGSSSAVFSAYMASAPHKANILRAGVTNVGIGTIRTGDGRVWDVMVFSNAYDPPSYGASRTSPAPIDADGNVPATAPANGPGVYLDTVPGAGAPIRVNYGSSGDVYLACDWNGTGTSTIAVFRRGVWMLRSSNTDGVADTVFSFGDPGDQPICGDWDGDGRASPGVFRSGQVFVRNSNSTGPADGSFSFGAPGDVAVVGDWDGDGYSTLGVQRGNRFFLTNSNIVPSTVCVVALGDPGDIPVAGDWNGDGYTTLGVVRNGAWYLADSNIRTTVSNSFRFGNGDDRPLVGHWSGGRADGAGVGRW